ncbi:sigma-70 family RNA polymerase sigma factor [Mycobacterium talmoniae]|uniref:RNA polymerase subunit sigma n=1 Tax=Mycobacterium talmoniae TaxID=1858794 RepID=A0A1S1NNK1_9MYCO|nr:MULTISPECIES: sigma-70 family RNA polymerase sigma factor [Mycobacterium]OHV05898.1 RNA polymerase subunit sigma [Mycobacterium talmoniae]TDH57803.1 sigma-70 family RNA polymerase sigma factor [Mycobacterium eburneum]
MSTLDDLARRFDGDRPHLRSVAFHLLGSAADAEDAVQSAWLKASRADAQAVQNLTGWFTTITARVAVDQLRARQRRAEQPLTDLERHPGMAAPAADEDLLRADAVSRALLVVLDRLSPAQRVAFVLHDVFGLPFEAIAEVLDRSTDSAKKLASRARAQLRAGPAVAPPRTAEHARIVAAFLAASRGGDIPTLLQLLAPDVVRRVDRVLVPDDVATEVRGATEVAEETRRFTGRARAGVVVLIDGAPGVAIAPGGHLRALLRIGIGDDDRIHRIDIIGDPDRLRTAALALPDWPV